MSSSGEGRSGLILLGPHPACKTSLFWRKSPRSSGRFEGQILRVEVRPHRADAEHLEEPSDRDVDLQRGGCDRGPRYGVALTAPEFQTMTPLTIVNTLSVAGIAGGGT